MRFLQALLRPEYFFNPTQVWRRLRRETLVHDGRSRLAWGLPIRVDPDCLIGFDIVNLGVFDLMVPEALYRLLDEGEYAIDVGANIGQNSSILALRAGPGGRVIACEPHPDMFRGLRANIDSWFAYRLAPVDLLRVALSSAPGTGWLSIPDGFAANHGTATLEPTHASPAQANPTRYEVELTTLDAIVPPDKVVGVLKLDVEGHEEQVLRGATRVLAERRIRDIVFEDTNVANGMVRPLLEAAGFTVFGLHADWGGPRLLPWRTGQGDPRGARHTMNYLGTLAPERAVERLRAFGWRCLRLAGSVEGR